MDADLPLAGGAPPRPGIALYARPRHPKVYGWADPDRVKCGATSRRGRQCARYAVELVDGGPCCRVHAIIARGGRIERPKAQQAELKLRPRRR